MIDQQQLIKKYFNSLVQNFIKDLNHENITVEFKDPWEEDVLGKTVYDRVGWEVNCTVFFLNHYKNEEELREVIVHEFAHLYIYSLLGHHEHDDAFYFHMDRFEDWMDKKWNLIPRQDKGNDWSQHISLERRMQRKRKFKQGFSGIQNYPNSIDKIGTLLLVGGIIVIFSIISFKFFKMIFRGKKNNY